jgi:hypothetical protein
VERLTLIQRKMVLRRYVGFGRFGAEHPRLLIGFVSASSNGFSKSRSALPHHSCGGVSLASFIGFSGVIQGVRSTPIQLSAQLAAAFCSRVIGKFLGDHLPQSFEMPRCGFISRMSTDLFLRTSRKEQIQQSRQSLRRWSLRSVRRQRWRCSSWLQYTNVVRHSDNRM